MEVDERPYGLGRHSKFLSEEKKQQVIALGKLDCSRTVRTAMAESCRDPIPSSIPRIHGIDFAALLVIEGDRRIEKGPRRFMDTALLCRLCLAARAERDRLAEHFAGSRTSDTEAHIVQGHIRDDDLHISTAFPAHLEPVLVTRCKRIEHQPAIRRDPVLAHLAKLLKADAVRGLHG